MCGWLLYSVTFLVGTWFTVFVGGWFVMKTTADYEPSPDEGLKGAGKKIGLFERTLVFVLVFADVPTAIGFLITAKSILRFTDISQEETSNSCNEGRSHTRRARSEYVIVGTLASFAWAVTMAYLTKFLSSGSDTACGWFL